MSKKDITTDKDLVFIDINEDEPHLIRPLDEAEYFDEAGYDESSDEVEDYEEEEEKGSKISFFHIIFIIVALGLIITTVVLLARWQKGIDLVVTEDDLTENFDIEDMDSYVPFNPADVEGYEDDGELNIVILGDDTIGNCLDDETGIPALIAKKTGANVTTCILKGGVIAFRNWKYDDEKNPEDAFSLVYQATDITGGSDGEYDVMLNAYSRTSDPDKYYEYWDILHKIKFKRADIIIVSYGINDYLQGFPILGDENDKEDHPYGLNNGSCAALYNSLTMLQTRFPATQVICVSPYFITAKDDAGNKKGTDQLNTGNGTLGEYVAQYAHFAGLSRVTFVDNYIGTPFNPDTYEQYLEEDGRTPTADARQLMAEHIMEYFYFNKGIN